MIAGALLAIAVVLLGLVWWTGCHPHRDDVDDVDDFADYLEGLGRACRRPGGRGR